MQNPHDWVRDETFELWNKYHPECKPKKEYPIKTGFGTRVDVAVFVAPENYAIGVEIVDSHAYEPLVALQKKLEKIVTKGETSTLDYAEKLLEFKDEFLGGLSEKILNYFKEKDNTPNTMYIPINCFQAGAAFILTLFEMADSILLTAFMNKIAKKNIEWENILKSDQRDRFHEIFGKWFELHLRCLNDMCFGSKVFNAASRPKPEWIVVPNICPKCESKDTIKWNRIELIEESEKGWKEKGFDYCTSCDYNSPTRVQEGVVGIAVKNDKP